MTYRAPANRMRELMQKHGIGEQDLAYCIDARWSQSQVNRYKNRKNVPLLPTAWQIVVGLRIATGNPRLAFEDVWPCPQEAA